MDQVKLLFPDKFPDLVDLKKESEVAGGNEVNLNAGANEFVDNVLILMVKIEAVKFKSALIVDEGCFGNKFFSSASTQAFDQVQYFDSLLRQDPVSFGAAKMDVFGWNLSTSAGKLGLMVEFNFFVF
jgi:hypothetical protein